MWGHASRASANASEAASAGDTVLVEAGTYATTPQCANSLDVWYRPENDGTSVSPITVQASGVVNLTITGTDACGVLIGANGQDYIIWDGFSVDEDNAPPCGDSGPIGLFDTTGSQVLNCTVLGNGWTRRSARTGGGGTYHVLVSTKTIGTSVAGSPGNVTITGHAIPGGQAVRVTGHSDSALNGEWFVSVVDANTVRFYTDVGLTNPVTGTGGSGGTSAELRLDNHSCVFTNFARGCRVYNCLFENTYGYGENTSSIITYDTWGLTVEHCEMRQHEGYGIFFKGMSPSSSGADVYGPTVVRYNWIHSNAQGGVFQGDLPVTDANRLLIYGNLIEHSSGAGRGYQCLGLTDSGRAPRHAWIQNNVFRGLQCAMAFRFVDNSTAGFHVRGNIVSSCARALEWWPATDTGITAAKLEVEHEVWWSSPTALEYDPEGSNRSYNTLSDLQATYAYMGSSSPVMSTGNPLFVSSTNLHLSSGSAASSRSRARNSIGGADDTIIDAGVYVYSTEVIGRR